MTFLFVDRILSLEPGKKVVGVKNVTLDDRYLTLDRDARLCFMPSLIGESLGQLAAWNVMSVFDFKYRPVAGVCSRALIHRHVYPGQTIMLESIIDRLDEQAVQYHSVATVDGLEVFTIENALGPMLPMENFIDENTVRNQFQMIARYGQYTPITSQEIDNTTSSLTQRENPHIGYDSIIDFKAGEYLIASKKITKSAPYFPDHFPKKPVLPLTILLESNFHLAHYFMDKSTIETDFQASSVSKVKMSDFVMPGDTLICSMKITEKTDDVMTFLFKCEVDGKRVCVAQATFSRLEH